MDQQDYQFKEILVYFKRNMPKLEDKNQAIEGVATDALIGAATDESEPHKILHIKGLL